MSTRPWDAVPVALSYEELTGLSMLGRAVQVEPMKPKLKPPGTERLTLERDELLSNFAFKFNLCRYSSEGRMRGRLNPRS
jgi:hypothetical protein